MGGSSVVPEASEKSEGGGLNADGNYHYIFFWSFLFASHSISTSRALSPRPHLIIIIISFQDRFSLGSPGSPGILSIDQAGLDLPTSVS